MLKTRAIILVASALVVWLIFLLPRVVVENESSLREDAPSSDSAVISAHEEVPQALAGKIAALRVQYAGNEKNAIFADSLASLYLQASKFDSAAWFADRAATFFNTPESRIKAGEAYYQAYTFEMDAKQQQVLAEKARDYFSAALDDDPKNLSIKSKMAMTYLSSSNPMQGIMMLREILQEDPRNEEALFNLGMLSIQSGQDELAVGRLRELIEVNPAHVQGHLLLGIALMNTGDKKGAKEQFEKVKELDDDPAVLATVESYLKDLK